MSWIIYNDVELSHWRIFFSSETTQSHLWSFTLSIVRALRRGGPLGEGVSPASVRSWVPILTSTDSFSSIAWLTIVMGKFQECSQLIYSDIATRYLLTFVDDDRVNKKLTLLVVQFGILRAKLATFFWNVDGWNPWSLYVMHWHVKFWPWSHADKNLDWLQISMNDHV